MIQSMRWRGVGALCSFLSHKGSVRDEAAYMSKFGFQLGNVALTAPLKDDKIDFSGILSSGCKVLKTGEALKEVSSYLSRHIIPSRSCQMHFLRDTFWARLLAMATK